MIQPIDQAQTIAHNTQITVCHKQIWTRIF